ncbi:MAG: ATP-binding domain-containing protein [Geobacteraceae bacterium]|nr:ATP-binding domain-containing protein [Geobacteraceae bacterium]
MHQEFYTWIGRPEMFKLAKGSKLEYADVFPLIYFKQRLEGIINPYREVKHLLIDEMQDYAPIQYAVLARLFFCSKTILGDVAQAVNPYSASNAEQICKPFGGASYMTLTRSYRSTLPIMRFADQISPNPELVPMKRNGEAPRVFACRSGAEESRQILHQATEFLDSEHNHLGIICKTHKQAKKIAAALRREDIQHQLLDASSADFSAGIIVCSAHMAKGLEFDRVIVPEVNATNYHTPMERNLLYVACTRAMHRLSLTHTGTPSTFLPH